LGGLRIDESPQAGRVQGPDRKIGRGPGVAIRGDGIEQAIMDSWPGRHFYPSGVLFGGGEDSGNELDAGDAVIDRRDQ
jgi:hypothetical protein